MGKIDKPLRIGRGHTPLWVTVCLTEKAWHRALKYAYKHGLDRQTFPSELHASATHFNVYGKGGPFTLITLHKDWRKAANALPLLAHEAVHCKQRCEELMGTVFDHETEAYYVQSIMFYAWQKIKRVI